MRTALRRFALLLAVALLASMASSATAVAAPSPRAQFLAKADSLCLAGSGVEETKATAVEAALATYQDHDTSTTRRALAYALTGLFLADWTELGRLEALHGPTAERQNLIPYETATYFLVVEAKPFIAAVYDDNASLVNGYAAKIASLSTSATRLATAAGLNVCGNGRGYVVRLRFKGSESLAAGTEIRLHRQGRTIAHAGEVLASRRAGAATTVLVAIASKYDPLHTAAQATVKRAGSKRYVVLADGPAKGGKIPYDGAISAA